MAQITETGLMSLDHKNAGCPINSICSKKNGNLLNKWEKLLGIMHIKNRRKAIKEFHQLNGSPLHFLSKKSLHKTSDVILWNSRCRIHNPKNPHNAIYKGILFSSMIPSVDGMFFDEIKVLKDKKVQSYDVGYEYRPVFMKSNRLFFLHDFEDYFYQSSIGMKGKIKIENLKQNIFTKAQSRMVKEVPCPKELRSERNSMYSSSYCQKILDKDNGKLVTILINWSCP
jgi:hypothetical protein